MEGKGGFCANAKEAKVKISKETIFVLVDGIVQKNFLKRFVVRIEVFLKEIKEAVQPKLFVRSLKLFYTIEAEPRTKRVI